jgi:hypothetical protein
VAVRLVDGTVFHGFGYSQTTGTRADTGQFWNRLVAQAEVVLGDGSKQLTFVDDDSLPNVATKANFAAASAGTHPLWFYGCAQITGGEWNSSGVRAIQNTGQLFQPDTGGADPYAGIVVFGNNLVTNRAAHRQVTLRNPGQTYDGGFFVSGGASLYNRAVASTERYSRVEGLGASFALMASMNEPRAQHDMVVLNDGRVLVVGGRPMAQGVPVASDTVGLWRLDEAIAGFAVDSGTHTLLLTDSGTTTIKDGESGNSRWFGASAYTARPSHDSFFNFQSAFTVEGWYNDSGHTVSGTLVSMSVANDGTANTNTQFRFSVVPSSDVYNVVFQTGLNVNTTLAWNGVTSVARTGWNHFAITFDGVQTWTLYINGASQGTHTATPATGGSSTKWALAHDFTAATANWTGGLDEIRVSNTAHDAAAIRQLLFGVDG